MIASFEALNLSILFLPGIIGYFIFLYIVDLKPKNGFNTVYFVLFFTILSQFIGGIFGVSFSFNYIDGEAEDYNFNDVFQNLNWGIVFISMALGVIFAFVKNNSYDLLLLHKLRLTKKVASRHPWNLVFAKRRGVWLRIYFSDGSQIVGWPLYYSDSDKVEQLYIEQAIWYVPQNPNNTFVVQKNEQFFEKECGGVLLTNFSNIVAIEII